METAIPETMKAATIDRFGGPEVFRVRSLSVPKPKPNQVLIRLHTAGIGVWDPEVRAGDFVLSKRPRTASLASTTSARWPLGCTNDLLRAGGELILDERSPSPAGR